MPEDFSSLSFEDALKRLETIVARLESGDVSLDESIKLYEQGSIIIKQCEERLNEAEIKIRTLGKD